MKPENEMDLEDVIDFANDMEYWQTEELDQFFWNRKDVITHPYCGCEDAPCCGCHL
jgi:hypothetical protein